MLIKKNLFMLLSLVLIVWISGSVIKAQEVPDESEDNNKPVVDSIDYREDLLDSNEAYKKQFDSLSKEGEWLKVNKTDFVRDLFSETGERAEEDYPQTEEIIYVWQPFCANAYWNPYSYGRWVFTWYGWIWVSDYSWGWGPYNYGRWYCSNRYGWIWMPGRVWAANWVTWRHHGNYVGWYPTCPRVFWTSLNNHRCSNHLFTYVPSNWVFVQKNDFIKKVDNVTIVNSSNYAKILRNSEKINPAVYVDPGTPKFKYNGPDVAEISGETGQKISPKQVEVTNTKGKQYEGENKVTTYSNPGSTFVKNSNTGNTSIRNNNTNPDKNDAGIKNKTKKENYTGTKPGNKNPIGNNGTKKGHSNKGSKSKKRSYRINTEKIDDGTNESSPEKSNEPPKESNTEKSGENTKESNTEKSNDDSQGGKVSDDIKGSSNTDFKK